MPDSSTEQVPSQETKGAHAEEERHAQPAPGIAAFIPNSLGRVNDPTDALCQLITSPDLSFLMEAHDGLSAAIARQAGFAGIWASGLSISASLGYRDANEASWTDVVEVVSRMVDASGLPILVDGDSGFGNFNNARLMAAKLLRPACAWKTRASRR